MPGVTPTPRRHRLRLLAAAAALVAGGVVVSTAQGATPTTPTTPSGAEGQVRLMSGGPTVTAPVTVGAPSTAVHFPVTIAGFSGAPSLSAVIGITSGGGTFSLASTSGLTAMFGYPGAPNAPTAAQEIGFFGSTADVTEALADRIRWTGGASAGSHTISVTVNEYEPGVFLNTANGHYYEYVSSVADWQSATTAAAARTKYGMTGYLATITSASENDFIKDKVDASNVWIGASDAGVEGTWKWVTGPEGAANSGAGTQFWQGVANGSAITYASWKPGAEPNDHNGAEDCAVTNFGGDRGLWNDFPCGNSYAYLVEYGSWQGTSTALSASLSSAVAVTATPAAPAPPTVAEGVGQVTLTWSAPDDRGSAITDYIIEYSANSGNWVTVNDGITTSATTEITGLNAGVSYRFRVAAVNANGTGAASTATSALTLSPAISWTSTSPLPGAKVNTAYTQALASTNGVGTLTYSLVSGSLPTGLSLSGTSITGTPTVLGTSTFTLRVTDQRTPPSTADREFTMQVVRGTRSPSLQSAGSSAVSLGSRAINTQRRSLTQSGSTMSHTAGSQGGASYSYQTDQTYSSGGLREGDQRSHTLSFSSNNSTTYDGRSAVSLTSSGECSSGNSFTSTNAYGVSINATTYCSVFGPEVWSNSFVADAGEALSFRWAAAGGGDDYETYAFLVNTSTNAHTVLAYGRGRNQPWTVASGVIPANGTYQFRFVNGSFDKSGGYYLGAVMYVDPTITVGSTQTITFPAQGTQNVGTPLNLTGVVTATSGLTPTLTSSTTGVCTVSGLTVSFLSTGSCTLTANQAGNSLYVPAASVTRTIVSGVLLNQTITFAQPADVTYGVADFTLNPTASSGLAVGLNSNTPDVCQVDGTTVEVAGVGTCELLAYQNGGGSYAAAPNVTRSFEVLPKPLTLDGLTGVDRPYDGGSSITVVGAPSLVGVVGSDSVTLSGTAAGSLHTSAAGVARTVTVSGLALIGTHAPRYSLVTTLVTATVSALDVSVAVAAGATNQYDGDTSFDLVPGNYTVTGVLNGESISVTSTTGTLDERHAGTRTVTVSALAYSPGAGTSLANYVLPTQVVGSVTVTPKPLTLTAVTPVSRHYDGTTVAAITGTTLVGVTGGDTVSIDPSSDGVLDEGAAGTRTLTTRVGITGTHVGNYTVTQTTAPIVITPRPVTAALTAGLTRVYDGGVTLDVTPSSYDITNVVGGESMTITNSVATLSARQVGTRHATVSALAFAPGAGTSLSNYDLPTLATGLVTVTPKTVGVTGAKVQHRPYDGSRDVTVTADGLSDVVDADAVMLVNTGLGTVPYAEVGDYRVSVNMSLAGADALNYALTLPNLRAMITPQPVRAVLRAGLEKTYDGNTAFPVMSNDVILDGVIPGQRLTVTSATGTLDSRNAGERTVTIAAPQFVPSAGTDLTNYQLPRQVTGRVTVLPFTLNVDNAQVTTRRFDGSIVAVITGATLRGVIGSDRVWLDAGTTGTFTVPNAARRIPVTSSMALGGADAGNYRLVQPTLVGEITRAAARIALSGELLQETDGSAKFLLADTTPAGVASRVTYNGVPLAPSAPGTYTVVATITDPNYEAATATATLTLVAPVTATTAGSGGVGEPATTATPAPTPTTAPTATAPTPTTAPSAPATPGVAPSGAAEAVRTGVIEGIDFVAAAEVTEDPTIAPVVQRPDGTPVDLAPMEVFALVNGEPATDATMEVVDDREVRFDVGGTSLGLTAQSSAGQATRVDADGNLVLSREGTVAVNGDGFRPGSRAEVWMFSTPTFLGYAEVGADGTFAGNFTLPDLLALGEHTVQVNGVGITADQWSVSMGVVVADPDDAEGAIAGDAANGPVRNAALTPGSTDADGIDAGPNGVMIGLGLLLLLAVAVVVGVSITRRRTAAAGR